jgi:tetratricopeptide (TPR) repeat protein
MIGGLRLRRRSMAGTAESSRLARCLAVAVSIAAVAVPLFAGAEERIAPQSETRQDASELFTQGNRMYETGDFEGAVATYEQIAERGVVSPTLHYNLGNAYYKIGDLGRAVLNYERALRLAPRDADARSNLALVRSMLRDKHLIDEPGYAKRAAGWVYHRVNLRESYLIASIVYIVLVIVIIGFIFREGASVSRLYRRLSLLSPGRFLGLDKTQDFVLAMATLMVLLVASTSTAYFKYRSATSRRAAIVVEEEVPVYGSPSEGSTLQFKIHEGTRVTTGQKRPGWIQVNLAGDLSGWINDRSVERI